MACELHIDEPPGGWGPPWPQARELARELARHAPAGWVLVGGLMVNLHARIAGIESRATTDVDTLVDVTVIGLPRVDQVLRDLGYELRESLDSRAPAHRWFRAVDDAIVDVLVADHLPHAPRFRRRPTVAAPGGTSVLQRHLTHVVVKGDEVVQFGLPTVAGAIVLKSRAYVVDSRERKRHLEDLAVLFEVAEDYRAVIAEMSDSDKKHVRKALRPLYDHLERTASATHRVRLLLPAISTELRLEPPLGVVRISPFAGRGRRGLPDPP